MENELATEKNFPTETPAGIDANRDGESSASEAVEKIKRKRGRPKGSGKKKDAAKVEEESSFDNSSESRGLYAACFGRSAGSFARGLSYVAEKSFAARFKKVGLSDEETEKIVADIRLPETTEQQIIVQCEILALKYDMLSRFGPEVILGIELLAWGQKIYSVHARLDDIEKRLAESKK